MSCPYALSLTTNASTDTNTNIKYDVDDNDNDDKTSTENHDDDDHHHHSSPIPSLPQVLNLNNLDKLDNSSNNDNNDNNNMTMTPMQALQLAKSSCPAFQSSCPFRNVQDAHSMKKALESLPKSHLEIAAIDTTATDASSAASAASAANNGVGKGGKGGNSTSGIHFEFEKDKDHSKKGHAKITSTTTESNNNSNSNNMTEHVNSKSNGRMSIGINQTLRVALQHVHNVSQSLRSGSELGSGSGSGSSVSMSMSAEAKTEAKTPTTTGSNKDPNSELEPFLPHTHTNTHTHTDHNNNTNNNTTVKPSTTKGRSRSNSFMESHRKFELAGGICPYKTLNPNYKSSGSSSGNGSAGGSGSSSNAVKFVNAMEELSFNAILAQLIDKQDTIASVTLPSTSTSTANSTANSASTSATTIPTTTKTQSQSTSTSTLRKSRSSNSLSTALKIGTAASHSSAESVHFVKEFIKGNIQLPLYIKLLSNLYWVYKTLECELDKFAPTSFPTLHKVELYRMESLQDDLEFFCTGLDFDVDVDNDENANANVNAEIERKIPPSQATKDYMHRIEYIAKVEPLLLLSHAYTRYLGDLSGGKVLARVAKRALNLGGSKSSEEGKGTDKGSSTSTVCDGLSFYHFSKIASAKIFKDEYRQSLDNLDFLTVEQIERLVAEANVAFVLNMRIFEELDVLDGVKGAAVRDYGEATSYYEECIKEQERRKEVGEDGGDDEGSDGDYDRGHAALFGEMGMEGVECPFAKLGGPNPHKKKVEEEGSGGDGHGHGRRTGKTLEVDAHRHKGDGRCPWPFVFFHDPKTGMQDWQTWLVIGLVLCWAWSFVVQTN